MSTRCSVLRIILQVALLTLHVTMEGIYYMHVLHYLHWYIFQYVRNLHHRGYQQISANHVFGAFSNLKNAGLFQPKLKQLDYCWVTYLSYIYN